MKTASSLAITDLHHVRVSCLGFLYPRNQTVFRVDFQIIVPVLQYFLINFGSSKSPIRWSYSKQRLCMYNFYPLNLNVQFWDHPKCIAFIYVREEGALLFFVKISSGQILTFLSRYMIQISQPRTRNVKLPWTKLNLRILRKESVRFLWRNSSTRD